MKRIHWYIIIGIVLFVSQIADAQEGNKEEFIQLAKKNEKLMYGHINKGEFAQALEVCSKKEDFYFKGESWTDYVKSRNDKAWIYHRMDSLTKLKETVLSNIKIANKYLTSVDLEWIRSKEQVNAYFYKLGDYKSALEISKEVIPLKEKLKVNKFDLAISYQNLGNEYNRLRDTENALSSFKKSIKVMYGDSIVGKKGGERYMNIARTYRSKGDFDSALSYLSKAESLYENIKLKGRFKSKKIATYILLVDTWIDKKDFKKAKYYLDLTKKIPLNTRQKIVWNERSAAYYREIKAFDKSKEAIYKADAIAKETGVKYSPIIRARRNIELAKTLIANSEDDKALSVLHESLQFLAPTFKSDDFHKNPKSDALIAKPDALVILQQKARILDRKSEALGDTDYLNSCYDTYLTACDVIRDVRQGIKSADSKNDLSEHTISVYEEAIKIAYKLSKSTGDKKYISTAFKLAESNKAQLLLENLNEQEARGFEGIPDSLLSKENDLRMLLATLEDRAIREGRNSDDDDNIFQLKQELGQFTTLLEKSYPRYYQLKYNNDPIGPEFVQNQLLSDSTALIEYFVGVEKIYVFVITKEDYSMAELNKNASEMEQLGKFRNLLKNRPGNDSPEEEYSNFVNTSRQVYEAFAKLALDKISESVKTLIIVPDDQINYIPFEVLLLQEPEEGFDYSIDAQSYLFEDYAVNYNYSATLLNKVISKETSDFKANFIGYAPTFSGESDDNSRPALSYELSNLMCNKDEVNSIKSMVGGDERLSENATKDNFLKEVKDYKIVHLATHAFVNQSDSKLNRIFLQDDFLSDVNLYNLELNTELAVLSACNTGSGELLKGEGVMNLARGFINAGCSSTLMSMWSVDDCTTSDLMILFYEEIKNGTQKDEALRRAKINYMESASKTKLHPYYWAAFIPFGDMKAMDLNTNWYLSSALPISLIVGIFILFLYNRQRKNKAV